MALAMSEGSSCSSRSWSGLRCSASRPLPIRLTVVSWPAPNSRMMLAVSSSLESLLPSSSACTSWLVRSSPGSRRRSSNRERKYSACGEIAGVGLVDLGAGQRHGIEQPPAAARAHEEQLVLLLGDAQHLADHGHRQPEGEVGDQVHLALRRDAIERRHRRSAWMRGRMSSTRRAVKAFTTRPRRRVWSGGSCCSIQWLMLR